MRDFNKDLHVRAVMFLQRNARKQQAALGGTTDRPRLELQRDKVGEIEGYRGDTIPLYRYFLNDGSIVEEVAQRKVNLNDVLGITLTQLIDDKLGCIIFKCLQTDDGRAFGKWTQDEIKEITAKIIDKIT